MNTHPLINELETPSPCSTTSCCAIHLPIDDAARIAALAEMYPRHTNETLITALLHHALTRLELPAEN